MVFFNFLNVFAIFLEFSLSRHVEMKQNETTIFIFSLSLRFTPNFGLKWSQNGIFNFLNVFAIFLEFSISSRVGTKRNDTFIFSLSRLYQPILAWNVAIMVFFNFLNFFAIFLEFSILRLVGTERNDNYYFLSFSAFSNLFWLEMKA